MNTLDLFEHSHGRFAATQRRPLADINDLAQQARAGHDALTHLSTMGTTTIRQAVAS